ncbi:MAG: DNA recombination protein RmuC, partial [Gammaproteobacteria bacterium]|nr:DNA recombination protein RmuC [Gammaproteobacteria bacterium]
MPALSDPRLLALALAGAALLGALLGVLLTQLRCQRRLGALETARATLAGQLEAERANAESRIEALEDARERLGETFEVLAAHALRSNQEDFLRLARESLGQFQQQAQSDLTQRQKAIDNMLLPIRTALEKTEQQ